MSIDAGERIVINQSLIRPQMVAGVERPIFFLVVGLGAYMVLPQNPRIVQIAALIIFFGGLFIGRKMGKADPQMWAIFRMNRLGMPPYLAPSRSPFGRARQRKWVK